MFTATGSVSNTKGSQKPKTEPKPRFGEKKPGMVSLLFLFLFIYLFTNKITPRNTRIKGYSREGQQEKHREVIKKENTSAYTCTIKNKKTHNENKMASQ